MAIPFLDRLANFVSGLGTARDKAAASHYGTPVVTDEELDNAYRGAWLPRKIVDIPAMDAIRNWRSWVADADQITAIEEVERRLGFRRKILKAKKAARLYGGAAVYIGTGDRDPSQPLRLDAIRRGGLRYLHVMTRKRLIPDAVDEDPFSETFGLPRMYEFYGPGGSPLRIHASRLVVLTGNDTLDDLQEEAILLGWGDSVLLPLLDTIKQADGTAANTAGLVFEALVDVLKIPGFTQGMGDDEYRRLLLERLRLASIAKGNSRILALDAEEEYDRKQINFSGLVEVLMAMLQLVSGGGDIPLTRLLGQSPGGLNASGESDLKNYYDRVRSIQELELRPAMVNLDEALIRSALGTRPPEIHYSWASLWQTTESENSQNFKRYADSIKVLADTQLWSDEVLEPVATNALVEAGFMPGLESEAEKGRRVPPAREDDETDGEGDGPLPPPQEDA